MVIGRKHSDVKIDGRSKTQRGTSQINESLKRMQTDRIELMQFTK